MKLIIYNPDKKLTEYISAYWLAQGETFELQPYTILPDGSIDLIFNDGPECIATSGRKFALQKQ